MIAPSLAFAQDAAPAGALPSAEPTERISLVAFGPNRLGVLVPINEHWMVRPDFGGVVAWGNNDTYRYNVFSGMSLILRTTPTEKGWVYGTLRYGFQVEQLKYAPDDEPEALKTHLVTLTAGGHAQVRKWLGVFGEAGVAIDYFEQGAPGEKNVIVNYNTLTRLGITLHREPAPPAARQGGERVALVFGGYAPVGLLIPLSDHWLVRPDVGANGYQAPQDDTRGWNASLGASLIHRTSPTEDGWLYTALRYGAVVAQEDAGPPRWDHNTSLTLGGYWQFVEQVAAFGETGVTVDQYVRGAPGSRQISWWIRPIQRFGVTVRRRAATH